MALALALPFVGLGEIVAMTGTAALGVAELVGVAAAIEVVSGLVGAVSGGAAITATGTTAAVAGTGSATGAGVATAATATAATAGGVAFAPLAAVGVLLGAGYALISQGGDIAAQPGVRSSSATASSPTTESQLQTDEVAANYCKTAIPSPPGPSRGPDDDGNEPSDDSDQHHPRLKKPIFVPKSLLEDLIKTHGRAIHRKLKRLTPDYQGTIWKNQDFRIDAGSTLHGRPKFKTWNLQVNRHPLSDAAKALKSKFGTHKKLLWGAFDVDKAPKYATWVEHILQLFDQ